MLSDNNGSTTDAGLAIEGITVRRGGRDVIADVSFEVNRGAVVAVIGPNGAGKTTLLETVVGVLPPTAGRVCYQGQTISRLRELARVFAFMPDAAEPPAEVSVEAFIAAAQRNGGGHRDEALLAALALTPLRSALVGELSRGEKRRLLL